MLAPATLPLAELEQHRFAQLLAAARLEALTLLRSLLTATPDTPGAVLRERRLAAQAILRIPIPPEHAQAQPAPIAQPPAPSRSSTPVTPPAPLNREKPRPAPIPAAPQPSCQTPISAGAGPAARLRACAGADRPLAPSLTG